MIKRLSIVTAAIAGLIFIPHYVGVIMFNNFDMRVVDLPSTRWCVGAFCMMAAFVSCVILYVCAAITLHIYSWVKDGYWPD